MPVDRLDAFGELVVADAQLVTAEADRIDRPAPSDAPHLAQRERVPAAEEEQAAGRAFLRVTGGRRAVRGRPGLCVAGRAEREAAARDDLALVPDADLQEMGQAVPL